MTTVQNVLDFMETVAPLACKMEWDHVGLSCGSPSQSVRKILVALDPFEHVCHEASEVGADLLITHHPLIFHPVEALTDSTAAVRGLIHLCRNNISAIGAHTNYDCAPGGVNDILAETLGLKNIHTIEGQTLLRAGEFEATLPEFLAHIKEKLGCDGLRYVDGGKPIRKVAVGGGACSGMRQIAIDAGCDTFVTSDIGYNNFWDAQELGLTMIDAGHFHTENPSMYVLAEKLRQAFPDVEVVMSQKHADCMKFY